MELVDEKLEQEIIKLQNYIAELDPGDPEYGKLMGRLDAMLRHRETQYRNEMDAVENDRRIDFDEKKLMWETSVGKGKNRNDTVRNLVEVAKTVLTVGGAILLGFKGYELEYKEHMNIPSKIWNFIPKIKS